MKMNGLIVAAIAATYFTPGVLSAADAALGLRESVTRQATSRPLQRDVPARQASRISRASKAADAIVGWYDKGHNYHAQKMNTRVNPKEQIYQRQRMRGRAVQ